MSHVGQNAQEVKNAQEIKHVSEINAVILALGCAGKMPSAML